jgi:hypothetical protein
MKKTLNITIGGRVFAIEEDAYERLNLSSNLYDSISFDSAFF